MKKKKEKERFQEKAIKETTKKQTNKQTKLKIRCNSSAFPPILSCDFLPCWFLALFLASPGIKKNGLSHMVASESYQMCDKDLDLQQN